MTIVWVHEIWRGRRGQGNRTDVINLGTFETFEFVKVFQVLTNNPLDPPETILGAIELPAIDDFYDNVPFSDPLAGISVCKRRIAEQDVNDPTVWYVRCEFAPDDVLDPDKLPTVVEFRTTRYEVPILIDLNQKKIQNSAFDPFDPPAVRDDCRATLRCIKNYKNTALNYIDIFQNYVNCVNVSPFKGFDANWLKLSFFEAVPFEYRGHSFWRATFDFEVRRDLGIDGYRGWTLELLDAGYHQLNDANPAAPTKVNIIDNTTGGPFSSPQMLNGAGVPLGSSANPIFLQFVAYSAAEFNNLGL